MNLYNKVVANGVSKEMPAISFLKKDLNLLSFTYGDLLNSVNKRAETLLGFVGNDRRKIAIIAPNSPFWVFTYISINKINNIAVMIDCNLPKSEIETLLKNTEVDIVATTSQIFQDKLSDSEILCLDIENELHNLNTKELKPYIYEEELEGISDILFSSGTTSVPSGIKHTQQTLIDTTVCCLNENKINHSDNRYLAVLPLNHIYGLLCLLYAPMLTGSHIMYLEELSSEPLMHAFKTFRPTFLSVVPKVCEMFKIKIEKEVREQGKEGLLNFFLPKCLAIREKTGINLGKKVFAKIHNVFGGCINTMSCGGALLHPDTAKFLIGLGFDLLITYGLTETNIPVTGSRGKFLSYNTIGYTYPGVEVKINHEGEILVKSNCISKGYYKNQTLTDSFMDGEYFKTGDVGYFDKKGRIVITGRNKENIVLSTGKKVFPTDIEEQFLSLKNIVKEFAVCGRKQEEYSYDEICLFVVGGVEPEDSVRKEIQIINQTLPPHMRVNKVYFVDEFPKTALEKIKRFELLKQAKEEHKPNNMTFEENIIYDCLKIAHIDLDYKTVSYDTKIFEDLGINSLSTIELLLNVESKYNITFEDAGVLNKDITVGEFINIIKEKMGRK